MKLEIILTPKAKDTFTSILLFIKQKWGDKSAEKFVKKAYRVLDTTAQQPYIFKEYPGNNTRMGIITKQTSFVYRITDQRIEILFFWDNRQQPLR